MTNMKAVATTDSTDGLPRRRAIQGMAGSLAGIAALGAVGASAKKKKKKSTKGTLVRFQTEEENQSIPPGLVPTTVTATCPAAGGNEQVFATGGGYETTPVGVTMFAIASQIAGNGQEWEVTFVNAAGVAQNASVSVVCAYFKK